jgi:ATP-binding cassette, subfamily B, bacterial
MSDAPSETASGDLKLLRRVFKESRGFRLRIIGIFLLSLLEAPLFLLAPVPLAIAVDSVLGDQPVPRFLQPLLPDSFTDKQLLIAAAVLQVLIVLLVNLQALATQVLQTSTSERLTMSFRSRLFSHVQQLSFTFHDRRGTSDSLYRIQYDTPSLGGLALDGVIPVVAAVVTLVSVLVVIIGIDAGLALIALAVCPLLILLAWRFKGTMRTQYKESKKLDSSAMGVVQETLSTLRVVKAFGREDAEHKRFLSHADRSVTAKVRLARTEGTMALLVDVVTAIGTGAVLYVGVTNVQSGVLTLGELLIVISYLSRLYAPLKTIARKVASIQSSLASAQRGFEILDEQPEVVDHPHPRSLVRASGAVEFQHVSFSYDRQHEVLHDVAFAVDPGARVGIAGRTGAGKTTLISLLMRFYDPQLGSIHLDGIDLREYRIRDLRNQFGLVLQEPVLFATSIFENIAYGRPDASLDEIKAAAEAAGADAFIRELPDGYETNVGERGMQLSGGERQRISIARAFLKNAPILILDEPTSSIDVATEAAIMDAMTNLMRGRTTFMIAHRLSTLASCDLFLRVDAGNVRRAEVLDEHASSPQPVGSSAALWCAR